MMTYLTSHTTLPLCNHPGWLCVWLNLTFSILNWLHLPVSFGRTESKWLTQNSPDSELRFAQNKNLLYL